MNKFGYLAVLLLCTVLACKTKKTPPKEIYVKPFGWRITIPEGFEQLTTEQRNKLQQKGAEAIEKTIGQKVENRAEPVFFFRSGIKNFMEANEQSFDTATDGSYSDFCKLVNQVVYTTFSQQIPNAQVDSSTSREIIDQYTFHVFRVNITMPNKQVLHSVMYNRLFEKKDLTLSLTYVDEDKGRAMLNAVKKSTFAKQE